MSAQNIPEGTYRISFMDGVLVGLEPNHPLRVLPEEQSERSEWQVKKHGSDAFVIVLKKNDKLGITWSGDLHYGTPLLLAENPAPFKVQQQERDRYDLVPAKDEQLEVALSPAMIFPPISNAPGFRARHASRSACSDDVLGQQLFAAGLFNLPSLSVSSSLSSRLHSADSLGLLLPRDRARLSIVLRRIGSVPNVSPSSIESQVVFDLQPQHLSSSLCIHTRRHADATAS
ncbi:hypothetical protein PaG_05646 [Moesziomyces aphidis]|uniref:Uncharacterized protein n=1 Tax=Moesziomyces aphidis TaxID=84754 RepID=W3VFV3_MOEAP|nr:hypothetical protein PaG_05646 [Moesziomyces aphidis]